MLTAAIFLIVGLVIGFFGGKQTGRNAAEQQLAPLVNLAFPRPADDIRSLTGVVKSIYGATITLEINDPDDYLPHLDGTPRAKQNRSANVTPDTKYVIVTNGQVSSKTFSSSDIKADDIITVRSEENIRDLETFDVSEVDLIK